MKITEVEIIDSEIGKNVKIIKPVNIYRCQIEDNVFIGPFVEVQEGVRIGKNTKIQSHTFICSGVEVLENCFIGHGVMFINDLFKNGGPANNNKLLWKKTKINNNVSIGSNSTILPVNICSGVVIGAGSVVTKDIHVKGFYAGNPAQLLKVIES
jgi:acetyltransferase-like isoleucine patch superfamily enzyme